MDVWGREERRIVFGIVCWRGQVRDRVAWGGEGGKGIGYGEVREVWLVDELCKRGSAHGRGTVYRGEGVRCLGTVILKRPARVASYSRGRLVRLCERMVVGSG